MSIARAMASKRSVTERNARAWLCPRARRAAYLALLTGSCWTATLVLARLMVTHGIGVRVKSTHEIKRIDDEYFDSE